MKTTITELMLQMKQFEQVKVEWIDQRWEVNIYPDPINTLGYHCSGRSINLRFALMEALHQTEKWLLLNAYNIELERLQAIVQAETDAKALVIEAKAEKRIEHFTAFCRFSEHVVGRGMWGE